MLMQMHVRSNRDNILSVKADGIVDIGFMTNGNACYRSIKKWCWLRSFIVMFRRHDLVERLGQRQWLNLNCLRPYICKTLSVLHVTVFSSARKITFMIHQVDKAINSLSWAIITAFSILSIRVSGFTRRKNSPSWDKAETGHTCLSNVSHVYTGMRIGCHSPSFQLVNEYWRAHVYPKSTGVEYRTVNS